MKELKMNPKVLSLLVLIGLFGGWQYMILATAFVLIVGNKDEKVMNLVTKVVIFFVACTLFSMFWQLCYQGYDVIVAMVEGLFKILHSMNHEILMPSWITDFLLNPLRILFDIADSGVDFIILFAKFTFIIAVIGNKNLPKPFMKINEYIEKLSKYVMDGVAPATPAPTATETMPASENVNQKVCVSCGNPLSPDAGFCTKCGTKQ